MDKRLIIAAVLYPVVQAVLLGATAVPLIVWLPGELAALLPHAVIVSLTLAAPISWELAPALSFELGREARLEARQRALSRRRREQGTSR